MILLSDDKTIKSWNIHAQLGELRAKLRASPVKPFASQVKYNLSFYFTAIFILQTILQFF